MGIDVACSALCLAHSRCSLDICSQREEEGHTGSGSLRTVCGWEGSETGKWAAGWKVISINQHAVAEAKACMAIARGLSGRQCGPDAVTRWITELSTREIPHLGNQKGQWHLG